MLLDIVRLGMMDNSAICHAEGSKGAAGGFLRTAPAVSPETCGQGPACALIFLPAAQAVRICLAARISNPWKNRRGFFQGLEKRAVRSGSALA
jgi:hypothetical protein